MPSLVFGHAHRADHHVIAGTSACYLNTGTWSDDVRGAGPDQSDDRLFPYVRVDATGEDGAVTAQAALHYWSAAAGVRGRPRRAGGAGAPRLTGGIDDDTTYVGVGLCWLAQVERGRGC